MSMVVRQAGARLQDGGAGRRLLEISGILPIVVSLWSHSRVLDLYLKANKTANFAFKQKTSAEVQHWMCWIEVPKTKGIYVRDCGSYSQSTVCNDWTFTNFSCKHHLTVEHLFAYNCWDPSCHPQSPKTPKRRKVSHGEFGSPRPRTPKTSEKSPKSQEKV